MYLIIYIYIIVHIMIYVSFLMYTKTMKNHEGRFIAAVLTYLDGLGSGWYEDSKEFT